MARRPFLDVFVSPGECNYIPGEDHQSSRKGIPALPFCKIALKAPKPASVAYPKSLKTLGDHLRKKRLDLKLLQKDAAQKLGVGKNSLCNWEKNRASPSLYQLPKIVKFLGYIPYDTSANTAGNKIAVSRRLLGLTQKELAHRLGIDPCTLGRWEKDKSQPSKKELKKLDNLFTSLSSDHPSLPLNLLLLKSLKRKSPS